MLLEKLRQHGGKIMFFMMNILAVATGVFFIKQKANDKVVATTAATDAQNYKSAADYALDAQARIKAEKDAKINIINSNPGTISKQQTVTVTKTIPAVTKKVTVDQPVASSSSPKSIASTPTPTPAPAPAPAKTTTKTS